MQKMEKESNTVGDQENLEKDTNNENTEQPNVKRMMYNVIVISFSFTLLFTAYQSTANLQSSLNAGLGTASLTTVYVGLVISCIFVPTFMITKLTVKWTIPVSMLGYASYIIAQYAPSLYSFIPTAFLVGLSAAPLWSAKCTYLTHVGTLKAKVENKEAGPQITKLFGIFFLFFQCSQVFGNLISSTVLSTGGEPIDPEAPHLEICGAVNCPWSNVNGTTGGSDPDQSQVTLLFSIYLACALAAAIVVAIFVDPLTRFGDRVGSATGLSGLQLLAATAKHARDHREQQLLIPLTIFSGLEQGYISADFTLAFITCAYGIQNVGYVMICFGICDAISSVAFGELIKIVGRVPIFTLGAALNIALIATMFTWKPTPTEPAVFYILAGLWGVSDAVWQTQINAMYGNLFPSSEEAAFSNYRLWESLGFIIAYGYSTAICINAKLWVLVSFLILGMCGYYTVEYMEKRKKAQQ